MILCYFCLVWTLFFWYYDCFVVIQQESSNSCFGKTLEHIWKVSPISTVSQRIWFLLYPSTKPDDAFNTSFLDRHSIAFAGCWPEQRIILLLHHGRKLNFNVLSQTLCIFKRLHNIILHSWDSYSMLETIQIYILLACEAPGLRKFVFVLNTETIVLIFEICVKLWTVLYWWKHNTGLVSDVTALHSRVYFTNTLQWWQAFLF